MKAFLGPSFLYYYSRPIVLANPKEIRNWYSCSLLNDRYSEISILRMVQYKGLRYLPTNNEKPFFLVALLNIKARMSDSVWTMLFLIV